jgi:mRNA interferase MazF
LLHIHPAAGTVVICDFSWFKAPEMIKRRPAVVISPRLRGRDNLCTVVPFSTTTPHKLMPYHYKLFTDPPLPDPYSSPYHWLKCDMVYTVSFDRMFMPFVDKADGGKRNYHTHAVSEHELKEIRKCVLNGLGMESLTSHV